MWLIVFMFFFFKQKTAYEMRISDWSSDVCSSDLGLQHQEGELLDRALRRIGMDRGHRAGMAGVDRAQEGEGFDPAQFAEDNPVGPHSEEIGRASCRERVCQYV